MVSFVARSWVERATTMKGCDTNTENDQQYVPRPIPKWTGIAAKGGNKKNGDQNRTEKAQDLTHDAVHLLLKMDLVAGDNLKVLDTVFRPLSFLPFFN